MALDKNIITIGIDMGGTKIAVAPFKDGKLIEADLIKEPTPQTSSEDILATMASMVEKVKANHDVKAVGVSTAGVVSDDGVMIGGTGNIPVWKGAKAKEELEKRTGLSVVVENDANCAAFGEYMVGCAANFNPVLLVILGTGVGGGIVWDDKIWRGAHYAGGEIGHVKIADSQTRRCTCGSWDCWEAYASGTGLQATARSFMADPEMDNYKLMEMFNKGDEKAIEVINTWHEYISLGMASMINTFDPACVVVSGGMAQFVNYPKLNKKVRDKVVDALKDDFNIVEGILGNDSGMIGAACLANLAVNNNAVAV